MSEPTTLPAPAAQIITVLIELKRIIHGVGNQVGVERALLVLLCTRLDRLRLRLHRLLTRPAKPALAPAAPKAPSPAAPKPTATAPSPTLKIPTSKQWLLKLLPDFLINTARGHVVHFIHHPETGASASQTPQLARQVLRPLCRFFSVPIPLYLQLPPRARKPRPKRIRKPKPKPIKPPKPPEPTFLEYLLAKYPPTDEPSPGAQLANLNQIRKLFSR